MIDTDTFTSWRLVLSPTKFIPETVKFFCGSAIFLIVRDASLYVLFCLHFLTCAYERKTSFVSNDAYSLRYQILFRRMRNHLNTLFQDKARLLDRLANKPEILALAGQDAGNKLASELGALIILLCIARLHVEDLLEFQCRSETIICIIAMRYKRV